MFKTFNSLSNPLKARLIHSFSIRLISTSIFPFMSLYLLHFFSIKQISFIIMAGTIFSILGQNFYKDKSFNHEQEKKIFNQIFCLLIVSLLLLSLSTLFKDSFLGIGYKYVFVSLLLIYYFLSGMLNPLIDSLIFPLYTKENKRKMSSINYILNNIASITGVLIGKNSNIDNIGYLFLVMMTLCIVSLLTFNYSMRNDFTSDGNDEVKKKIKSRSRNRLIIIFSISTCFAFFMESRLSDLIVVFLHNYDLSNNEIRSFLTYVLLINYSIAIFGSSFISKRLENISSERLVNLGLLILAASYSSFLLIPNPLWSVVTFIVIYTIGECIYFPNRQLCLMNLIKNKSKAASIFATDRTVMSVSKIFSAILIPLATNPIYLFIFIALISTLSFVSINNIFKNNSSENLPLKKVD